MFYVLALILLLAIQGSALSSQENCNAGTQQINGISVGPCQCQDDTLPMGSGSCGYSITGVVFTYDICTTNGGLLSCSSKPHQYVGHANTCKPGADDVRLAKCLLAAGLIATCVDPAQPVCAAAITYFLGNCSYCDVYGPCVSGSDVPIYATVVDKTVSCPQ